MKPSDFRTEKGGILYEKKHHSRNCTAECCNRCRRNWHDCTSTRLCIVGMAWLSGRPEPWRRCFDGWHCKNAAVFAPVGCFAGGRHPTACWPQPRPRCQCSRLDDAETLRPLRRFSRNLGGNRRYDYRYQRHHCPCYHYHRNHNHHHRCGRCYILNTIHSSSQSFPALAGRCQAGNFLCGFSGLQIYHRPFCGTDSGNRIRGSRYQRQQLPIRQYACILWTLFQGDNAPWWTGIPLYHQRKPFRLWYRQR